MSIVMSAAKRATAKALTIAYHITIQFTATALIGLLLEGRRCEWSRSLMTY